MASLRTLIRPATYQATVHPVVLPLLSPSIVSKCTVRNASNTGLDSLSQPSLGKRRKAVTVTNDDGRVPWGDLSPVEKVARTTQQTFNFTTIIVGLMATCGVAYVLYTEVFSPSSKTSHFNRAVDFVRAHPEAVSLLGGPGKNIQAYGESVYSRMARNRPIASRVTKDAYGNETLYMHFNVGLKSSIRLPTKCMVANKHKVEGSSDKGIIHVHLVKLADSARWEYKSLALDVKSHERLHLIQEDPEKGAKKSGFSILGLKFR